MKKSIMAAFAAIFLGAACVGFAACGAGGPDAKSVEGIEVTEEQWNEAIRYFWKDDAECAIRVSSNETAREGDKSVKTTGTGEGRVKGGKAYVNWSVKMSGNGIGDGEGYIMSREEADEIEKDVIEYYGLSEDGTTYIYKKIDGNWGRNAHQSSTYNVTWLLFSGVFHDVEYSSYEYSAENKGYVAKNSRSGELFVLKFGKVEDAVRLIAIYWHADLSEGGSGDLNGIFSYNGVADITLPDVG